MATVLVTGVGGAAGIGAVQTLTETTEHDVVGVDMDADAAGLYLADHARTVPRAADDDWAREMTAVIHELDVDVVVPTVDEELPKLSKLPADVPTVAPREGVVDIALDKFRSYHRLRENGHRVPRTWLATKASSVPLSAYPLIVKPRRGRGSRGVRRVDTPQEATAAVDAADYERGELLLQRFVEGREYTTSVVTTSDNEVLSVVPKEAIEKDGSTVKGVTRRNQAITRSCRAIAETLGPAGPINVQQIVDAAGAPYTIEINPRFSSTSCLTVEAGVNEFDLLIRDALDHAVTAPDGYEAGIYILRYDGHVFVPEAQVDQTEAAETIATNQRTAGRR